MCLLSPEINLPLLQVLLGKKGFLQAVVIPEWPWGPGLSRPPVRPPIRSPILSLHTHPQQGQSKTGTEPGHGVRFIEGGPKLVRGSAPAAYGLLDPVQIEADVGVDARSLGLPTGV